MMFLLSVDLHLYVLIYNLKTVIVNAQLLTHHFAHYFLLSSQFIGKK